MKENKEHIMLSAADIIDAQILEDKMPSSSSSQYVNYGKKNDYPNYLNDLVQNCAVLNSVINAYVDYSLGEDIQFSSAIRIKLNGNTGSQLKKIIKKIVYDKTVTGAWAIKLIYNRQKEIAEIEWIDIRNVRLNIDKDKAFVSETFGKGRRKEIEVYSTFDHFVPGEDENNPYACVYYDNGDARGVYAVPSYSGALRSIETAIQISKFHLSSIQNNLASNAIINIPDANGYTDEEKREIERQFQDKFCGASNGSSFMLAFCETEQNKVTVERIQDDNLDKKYEALSKDTYGTIFTAFRMPPQLAGYVITGSLFNKQEFAEAFELFLKTVIVPFQRTLINSFDYIFETSNSLEIEQLNFID